MCVGGGGGGGGGDGVSVKENAVIRIRIWAESQNYTNSRVRFAYIAGLLFKYKLVDDRWFSSNTGAWVASRRDIILAVPLCDGMRWCQMNKKDGW